MVWVDFALFSNFTHLQVVEVVEVLYQMFFILGKKLMRAIPLKVQILKKSRGKIKKNWNFISEKDIVYYLYNTRKKSNL